MWQAIIGPVINTIGGIIDQSVEDKDQANQLKANITTQLLSNKNKELEAAKSIIVAEAKGESWLQRNWRPVLMLSIVAIVVNNYLLFPYMQIFNPDVAIRLDLPAELFNLMTVGVGGYVVGRSGEKIAKSWKSK